MSDTGDNDMGGNAHLTAVSDGEERRIAPRKELFLETQGELTGGRGANVTVYNISKTGLLIETDQDISNGELLTMELPAAGRVSARIVWVSGRLVGCAFDEKLSDEVLAAAQSRSDAAISAATGTPARAPRLTGDLLGSKINRLRRERGLTLAQVADALGVSKPTVWAWEKSKARPVPDRFEAIAEVLGVSPTELAESAETNEGDALVQDSKVRIANAFGTTPDKVRIYIEV